MTQNTGTPTTVVLVRHGETPGNRDQRYQTYDTPLSETGRVQAARVAERLVAAGPFAALYTSDLERTHETARAIGVALGLAPVTTAALRELDTGDHKGRPRAEVEAEAPGWLAAWVEGGGRERMPGPEGEGVAEVYARATAFFDEVCARHPGERVVLVSHGWTLAVLLAQIHGWDHHDAFAERRIALHNTAVSVVEVDADGARRCLLLGCTAHLSETPGLPLLVSEVRSAEA